MLMKKQMEELVEKTDFPMMEKAFDFFEKTNFGMSEIQIEKFALNRADFPTSWSRFRQAKLELWSKYCSIMDDYFSHETANANIELEKAKIAEEYINNSKISEAKTRLSEIEIEKNEFKIRVIKKQVKDKIKEMAIFLRIIKEEEEKIEGNEKEEDKKFWDEKIKKDPRTFKERYDVENV